MLKIIGLSISIELVKELKYWEKKYKRKQYKNLQNRKKDTQYSGSTKSKFGSTRKLIKFIYPLSKRERA